jgi:hypothetical protein
VRRVREFHAGAEWDVPEVQYLREYDGVFVRPLNDLFSLTSRPPALLSAGGLRANSKTVEIDFSSPWRQAVWSGRLHVRQLASLGSAEP